MGAYARTNEDTFSYMLAELLKEALPERSVSVINAGIAGYTLADQARMLERLVLPLGPDLIIVYPGSNDFAGYCGARQSAVNAPEPSGLPLLKLPSWVLSTELIRKNTVALRTPRAKSDNTKSAASLDIEPYRKGLQNLVRIARQAQVPIILSTNARSYREEQPLEVQVTLSQTARYYNPCFDLPNLHLLYDRHNAVIQETAVAEKVGFVDLGRLIPGGVEYFVDSSHFSRSGEVVAAESLFRYLSQSAFLSGPE
jgi:lysophospholipase L1-like esterase